jgi:DNA-binding beta-propeller fold protein YncE
MMVRRLIFVAAALSIVALVVTGCGGPPRPGPELVWPAPPAEAKIVFSRSLYGNQDLKRSFLGKIKDFLFGRSTQFVIGKPYGVVYDGKSKIYIADTAKKGILELDLSAGTSRFFNSLGPHGTLVEPIYVILDSHDSIYVSDTELGRVVVFGPDHKFARFVGSETDLERPVGMAFDERQEFLYVVDTQGHRVSIFDRQGNRVGQFGQLGHSQGEFYFPLTVAIGEDGTIYIVDSFHFAVQAFDRQGEYLFSFGSTASSPGTMARPRDIAIDSDYHLYVTDALRNNVQIFKNDGELLMSFGAGGSGSGEFQLPAGICIDNDDNIYISDSMNRRIQVFRYLAQE